MGRRIYIHERSLGVVAARDPKTGAQIVNGLLNVALRKMAHRHLIEDGEIAGFISKKDMKNVLAWTARFGYTELSHSFRFLVYRPSVDDHRDSVYQILGKKECISAACFDDGYFTFATDESSARLMFDDVMPIKTVREAYHQGATSVTDLTLIRGKNLAPLDSELGYGEGKAQFYKLFFARRAPEYCDDLEEAILRALSSYRAQLEELRSELSIWFPTSDHDTVVKKIEFISDVLENSISEIRCSSN